MTVTRHLLLTTLVLTAACADGGMEERPTSEVNIAANHHLLWYRTLPGLGALPIDPADVFTGNAVMAFADDSTYSITTSQGSSDPDRYALAANGDLSVFFVGSGRDPGVVFRGGYGLVGGPPDLFFTDRVSNTTSASIGLYYGMRVALGQIEFEGGWHLLSMHSIFANGLPTARSIGRAAQGSVTIAAGAPGTLRAISGSGLESGSDPSQVAMAYGGSIQNLLDGTGSGDGTSNLTVDFTSGGNTDSRVYHAVAGPDIVMAVDMDESDGSAGALFLVREFDAPTTVADITQVAGEYLIGGQTLFVNPFNSGADSFVGRLSLTPQGAFTLAAEGHQGQDFTYTGSFTVADSGALAFTVSGTNEAWFGAISRTYETLTLVDAVVENRANNTPELNLVIGIREKDV